METQEVNSLSSGELRLTEWTQCLHGYRGSEQLLERSEEAELPLRDFWTSQVAWRRASYQQRAPGMQLSWISTQTEVSLLVVQLFLNHPCSCKQPLTHIPVVNPNETHWFTKLDFGRITLSVYCWFPIGVGWCLGQVSLETSWCISYYIFWLEIPNVQTMNSSVVHHWKKTTKTQLYVALGSTWVPQILYRKH